VPGAFRAKSREVIGQPQLGQKALALLATVCVIGAVIPWSYRVTCLITAVVIILLLAYMRTSAAKVARDNQKTSDVYAKIARIRAARKERFRGR